MFLFNKKIFLMQLTIFLLIAPYILKAFIIIYLYLQIYIFL